MDERLVGMRSCVSTALVFIALAICAFSINAREKGILYTEIEKHSSSHWTVNYQSNGPINAIMFASSPDNSRLKRWQPVLSEFSVNYINGREIVKRKDGNPFTSVRIKLTPSYIHLPKSYTPFSPFSDGGMLLHSARFFACPNICSGNENLWAIAVKAPVRDSIVLDGKAYLGKTS